MLTSAPTAIPNPILKQPTLRKLENNESWLKSRQFTEMTTFIVDHALESHHNDQTDIVVKETRSKKDLVQTQILDSMQRTNRSMNFNSAHRDSDTDQDFAVESLLRI